jgi:hypothetical protein
LPDIALWFAPFGQLVIGDWQWRGGEPQGKVYVNTPELMWGLFCEKRQHPLDCDFMLGYDGREPTFDRELLWPTEDALISILCSECSEIAEYALRDVRTVRVPAWHPYTPGSRYIWRIQARCVRESCGFEKAVYFQSRGSIRRDIWRRLLEKGAWIKCPECGEKIPLTEMVDECTQRLGIV